MTPAHTSPPAMGAEANPLDALLPNITPEPIGWFPLALGWWVLLAVIVLALIALVLTVRRQRRKTAYRRRALEQLRNISDHFDQHQHLKQLVQDCNRLLKATALQAWPREQVAALSGKEWLAFLDQSLPLESGQPSAKFRKGPGQILGHGLYNKEPVDNRIPPAALLKLIRYWLKNHQINAAPASTQQQGER